VSINGEVTVTHEIVLPQIVLPLNFSAKYDVPLRDSVNSMQSANYTFSIYHQAFTEFLKQKSVQLKNCLILASEMINIL
jgi:hypothetical protein